MYILNTRTILKKVFSLHKVTDIIAASQQSKKTMENSGPLKCFNRMDSLIFTIVDLELSIVLTHLMILLPGSSRVYLTSSWGACRREDIMLICVRRTPCRGNWHKRWVFTDRARQEETPGRESAFLARMID